MKFKFSSVMVLLVSIGSLSAAPISLIPEKITPAVVDKQDAQNTDRVHLTGWVGLRMELNESNRLAKLDAERLLEGYRKRPGRQKWDGEHVGKWLHAATLAWANTGDVVLRKKLDFIVAELMKCQLDDGYLGTYAPEERWTEWDVWAHKYNLIGLVTYMRYTGNLEPLPTCRRMADLLCNTFGDTDGKRDIIPAGQHKGMAPTSVLEPMVLLYRLTGEAKYLDFCKYILRSWEQANGPKIPSELLATHRVDKVGDGKAYEMLSCLNGALEYYRTTGEKKHLDACLYAWDDITRRHLYLTGTASYREFFHAGNFDLPNVNNVGETCVTVTWLQFNAHLLRLTGEARFAEQMEKTVLNQLMGAQSCDGTAWGYYVQMEGKKPYSAVLDGHCCLSSGPRGVALIPTFAVTTDGDGVVMNLYDAGSAKLNLHDKTEVTVETETMFPSDGRIVVKISPEKKSNFTVKLRLPKWSPQNVVQVNGKKVDVTPGADGYAAVQREWKKGDKISLLFMLKPHIITGEHKNEGKLAVTYGPLVLAADESLLGASDRTLHDVQAAGWDLNSLEVTPEPAVGKFKTWAGAHVFRINATASKNVGSLKAGDKLQIDLVPFADAGGTLSPYRIWLPYEATPEYKNVLLSGLEGRSRKWNIGGSIIDDELDSIGSTFNGKKTGEDWYAVTMDEPVTVSRVVVVQGKTFHNGGWFNTEKKKPQIQFQIATNAPWQVLCDLKDYPATTLKDSGGLKGGETFTCVLEKPVEVKGIRLIGQPSSGDNLKQDFTTCAELQAFQK